VKEIKNCYCGAPCDFEKEDEPCWGDINAVDEVYDDDGYYEWIHACEGHRQCSMGGPYIQYIKLDITIN